MLYRALYIGTAILYKVLSCGLVRITLGIGVLALVLVFMSCRLILDYMARQIQVLENQWFK